MKKHGASQIKEHTSLDKASLRAPGPLGIVSVTVLTLVP